MSRASSGAPSARGLKATDFAVGTIKLGVPVRGEAAQMYIVASQNPFAAASNSTLDNYWKLLGPEDGGADVVRPLERERRRPSSPPRPKQKKPKAAAAADASLASALASVAAVVTKLTAAAATAAPPAPRPRPHAAAAPPTFLESAADAGWSLYAPAAAAVAAASPRRPPVLAPVMSAASVAGEMLNFDVPAPPRRGCKKQKQKRKQQLHRPLSPRRPRDDDDSDEEVEWIYSGTAAEATAAQRAGNVLPIDDDDYASLPSGSRVKPPPRHGLPFRDFSPLFGNPYPSSTGLILPLVASSSSGAAAAARAATRPGGFLSAEMVADIRANPQKYRARTKTVAQMRAEDRAEAAWHASSAARRQADAAVTATSASTVAGWGGGASAAAAAAAAAAADDDDSSDDDDDAVAEAQRVLFKLIMRRTEFVMLEFGNAPPRTVLDQTTTADGRTLQTIAAAEAYTPFTHFPRTENSLLFCTADEAWIAWSWLQHLFPPMIARRVVNPWPDVSVHGRPNFVWGERKYYDLEPFGQAVGCTEWRADALQVEAPETFASWTARVGAPKMLAGAAAAVARLPTDPRNRGWGWATMEQAGVAEEDDDGDGGYGSDASAASSLTANLRATGRLLPRTRKPPPTQKRGGQVAAQGDDGDDGDEYYSDDSHASALTANLRAMGSISKPKRK